MSEQQEQQEAPPPPAAVEFKTARQIEDEGKPNCIRCERLGRRPPRKGYPFCKICYEIEMPSRIYTPEIYKDND